MHKACVNKIIIWDYFTVKNIQVVCLLHSESLILVGHDYYYPLNKARQNYPSNICD